MPHETKQHMHPPAGTAASYALGFGLSILLTLLAFGAVALHAATRHSFPSHQTLYAALLALAVLQLLVQAILFLHVRRGSKPHWNAVALTFTAFVVVVVVGGTIWIMANLRTMDLSNIYLGDIVSPQTESR